MSYFNPVDWMIQRTHQSRAEITAKHGLGKNLLLRCSQGRVQSITPRVEAVLWKEWSEKGLDQDAFDAEFGTLSVALAFEKWRESQRIARRGLVPTKVESNDKIPPFARLVKAVGSISATAKLLMVADLPVQNYAQAVTATMPEPIRTALTEMAYPHVEQLDKAQLTWKMRTR